MVSKYIDGFGNIFYYNDIMLHHREDGPALEYTNGDKGWCINGVFHRIDGPAIERIDGYKAYYIMSKLYSYEDWLAIKDYPLLW